jgi:chemotaxis protein CheX
MSLNHSLAQPGPDDGRPDVDPLGRRRDGRHPFIGHLMGCYVSAAVDVLTSETGAVVERQGLQIRHDPYTTEDVTAMIGVSGSIAGSIFLSMTESTALALVGRMMDQTIHGLDELTQSGIAELANVVAGTAGIALGELGYTTSISPPLLLLGAGAQLSSVEMQRLVVPLGTTCGDIRIHVSLSEPG